MPTYVFKCESCGGCKPFLIHEADLPNPEGKNPIQKHCPTCRAMTSWSYAFPEQRSGKDRRTAPNRRS